MKLSIVISFSILFLVVSCKSPNTKILSHQVHTDTIFIPVADSISFSFASIKQINDDVFVCIKDEITSKLYIFNYVTDSIKDLRIYDLPASVMDTINGKINNIDIISRDSLLICQDHLLSIYNLKTETVEFSYTHSLDDSLYVFHNNQQEISWNSFDNNILSIIYRFDNMEKENDTDADFSGFLDPKTKKVEIIPIKLPSIFQTNLKNTMFGSQYITVTPDYYVAAFGITPDLTVYNRKTKEIKNIPIKSSQYPEIKIIDESKSSDIKTLFNHFMESVNFTNIQYDRFNNIYYRFYFHPIVKKDMNDDFLYELGSKALGVTILSEDFKVIGDLFLNNEIHPFKIFVTSDGLMQIQNTNEKNKAVVRMVKYEK